VKDIKIELCEDSHAIYDFLVNDAELFARISESGESVEDYSNADFIGMLALGISIGDDLAALITFNALNRTTVNVHMNVKSEHRKTVAGIAGKALLNFVAHDTNFQKAVASIPVIYYDVLKYSKRLGFNIEGINKQSTLKNGELTDCYYVGITRSEMIEKLENNQWQL